jgi:methylenetetrahydrofolate--tRNA-(uracil-5-)-methyltransferase
MVNVIIAGVCLQWDFFRFRFCLLPSLWKGNSKLNITIIGAGLAGCEAAWQAANRGIEVMLFEMKPKKYSPAHHLPQFAELVCSNSLRADGLTNAVGLLKEEMRRLNSLIIQCADCTRVPAGGALAVDRTGFSEMVTQKVRSHPKITVVEQEITQIPQTGLCIIATGPLTSQGLSESIKALCGTEELHFFDAAAPIVEFESINLDKAYFAARYGKGGDDYINCPMTKAEYDNFYNELINAKAAELHEFDKQELKVFEGCMPVEVMAQRGHDTLLFGPLKPVGLQDPKTGKIPYAVVQLRQDNAAASLYNIVGFQTHLKFAEQKRVFSLIPSLENAEFVRYGIMHRNTYINSPQLLDCFYRLKSDNRLYFAGQMTGVEGYVESAASGLLAGINCALQAKGEQPLDFTGLTACGALAHYVSNCNTKHFEPMNINFGLLPSLEEKEREKQKRYEKISLKALDKLNEIILKIEAI